MCGCRESMAKVKEELDKKVLDKEANNSVELLV